MFALDADDLDTELDATPWAPVGFERHERERVVGLVRSRHAALVASVRLVPLRSIDRLASALGHVAAFVESDRHFELFTKHGLLSPYLSALYAAADDALTGNARAVPPTADPATRPLRAHRVHEEGAKLERVADTLPDDVRAAVAETFGAFRRFEDDLA